MPLFFCAKSDKVKEPSIPGGSFGERIFVLWNMKQKDNTCIIQLAYLIVYLDR